jgi:triosephosphate isomerase
MMKRNIVAGNWKMNKTFQEADDLLFQLTQKIREIDLKESIDIIVCPPAPFLELATDLTEDTLISVGAQNVHDQEEGAYTGETSVKMLQSMDVEYCIVGHSERRKYFQEKDDFLLNKVKKLIDFDIIPIFCFGEQLDERNAGKHFDVVKKQLKSTVFQCSENEFSRIILAYEPIWAIGTGVNATPEQAQEMHAFIRSQIAEQFSAEIAGDTTILYGGSCNPKNAQSLFANKDVDGGLIGGASLKADDFIDIIKSF